MPNTRMVVFLGCFYHFCGPGDPQRDRDVRDTEKQWLHQPCIIG